MDQPFIAHRPGSLTRPDPTRLAPPTPAIPDQPDAITRRGDRLILTYDVEHDGTRAGYIAAACDFLAAYLEIDPAADSVSIEFEGETIVILADAIQPGPAQ